MKSLLPPHAFLIAILVAVSSPVFADGPSSSSLKLRIELTNGTIKTGYIAYLVELYKDEAGHYYRDGQQTMRLRTRGNASTGIHVAKTDYHFHRYIQLYCTKRLNCIPLWK